MNLPEKMDSLRRGLQYGLDNGKKNLIVDLDCLQALFLVADSQAGGPATYEYATMGLGAVLAFTGLTGVVPDAGSYLSDDAESRRYRYLITHGFRWVRTDDDMAVFERQTQLPTP